MNYQLIPAVAAAMTVSGLLLLASAYWRLRRRLRHLHRDEQLVMSRARQKALGVVAQARDQALDIIAHAKISANTDKLKLEEHLDKISADQLREFQKLILTISKTIESDAVKEIGEFKQALELETVQSQRVVAQRIENQYSQVLQELAEMKRQKLAELDKQTEAVIKDVVMQVTGKIIPLEEHEKLIIKALEDAKKRHLV